MSPAAGAIRRASVGEQRTGVSHDGGEPDQTPPEHVRVTGGSAIPTLQVSVQAADSASKSHSWVYSALGGKRRGTWVNQPRLNSPQPSTFGDVRQWQTVLTPVTLLT